MMEIVYFTLAAMVLYVGSDWILNRIEKARGGRFKNRSLVFFMIILTLSVSTFSAIQYLGQQPTTDTRSPAGSNVDQQP